MFDGFFADPKLLALGAVTGFVFGFLLQKGGVTRFNVIVGQFLLKDFTVLKVMLTAIVVGAVGIYGMRAMGVEFDMHIKSAALVGNALGGAIFGIGMAVLGFCPGSAVAAIGDGSRHAIAGVLGMLAGAAIYAETHSWLQPRVLEAVDLGKATLASMTGLSPWLIIAALAVVAAAVFVMLERSQRKGRGNMEPG